MSEGLSELGFETQGQRMVRNDVAYLAERWGWSPSQILALPVRTRRAYCYRVSNLNARDNESAGK